MLMCTTPREALLPTSGESWLRAVPDRFHLPVSRGAMRLGQGHLFVKDAIKFELEKGPWWHWAIG